MNDPREISLTPGELNRRVRTLLETHFDFVWVEGEISNFAAPSSGHWYFSIKDDSAQVRCAMFRNRNQRLRFRPQNGDAVRLRARVSLYEARGEFQLIGEFMEPAGAGALQARFEALRDRLAQEGLFDAASKQPLPERIPHVAVVTSPTGAALQDILTVLRRRSPLTRVTVLPAAVQGDGAAPQLCAALARANRLAERGTDFAAIILARGGGSLEDLWPFNEESVARAIAVSRLPVVCGVGHETDVTIADFTADVRAPTPSAAAELVSDDMAEVLVTLRRQRTRLLELARWRIATARREVTHLRRSLRHPGARLREQAQRLDERELQLRTLLRRRLRHGTRDLHMRAAQLRRASPRRRIAAAAERQAALRDQLARRVLQRLQQQKQALAQCGTALRALSPLAILERGYAIITTDGGEVIADSRQVTVGQPVQARLHRGRLALEVLESLPADEADTQAATADEGEKDV